MRYASKRELVADIEGAHGNLLALLRSVPLARYGEPGVWGDGWSVKDLVAHLTAWHGLFLRWYEEGQAGKKPEIPAPGYKYSEIGKLNRAIWREHREESVQAVMEGFESSYVRVLKLARSLSEPQLIEAGHFAWTGKNGLKTYLGANTASHYRFAVKVLKRWSRREKAEGSTRANDAH